MNHSHGLNITRGYVKIDFTPAWELNAKVIDFIFFSSKKSKQGKARDFETPADKMFRITKKMMIYGRAYFKGDVIGEITDIGFSNVDQVIDRLVEQAINTKGGFYLSLSEPHHFLYWCGSFLFVRLIPSHDFTTYNYSKDKYDKLPYNDESFLDQPDYQTYGHPQKPEYQFQEQHTDNKYRQQIYNQQHFKHNV